MKRFMFSLTTRELQVPSGERVEFQVDDAGRVTGYHYRPSYYGEWQWCKMERAFTNDELAAAVDKLKVS